MPFGGTKEIESIYIPVKSHKKPEKGAPPIIKMEKFPIVYPHRVLEYLFYTVGITVDEQQVKSYWEHARAMGEAWAVESDASVSHVPLGLHGDSARLKTEVRFEKQLAIWLNIVLWRPRSVRCSRFLLFSMPSLVQFKNRSLNKVFKVLRWSLNAAFEGVHPRTGPYGEALSWQSLARAGTQLTSDGKRFAVTELRGDWEWHRDTFRPKAAWNAKGPVCHLCPALREGPEEYVYHNFGPNCRWMHECFSTEEFIARRLKDRHLCASIKNMRYEMFAAQFVLEVCLEQLWACIVRRSLAHVAILSPGHYQVVQHAHDQPCFDDEL